MSCEDMDDCEWEESSDRIYVHGITYCSHGKKFEALVNVTVECIHCGDTHELCMSAEDEVTV